MFSATLNVHFIIKKFDYLFQLLLKTAITVHLQLSGGQETWNFLWMEGFRGRGNLKLSLNGRFQGERKLEIFSDWKVSGGEETWNYLWLESFRRRGNLKLSLNGRFQEERKLETFSDWKVSGGDETWNFLRMESIWGKLEIFAEWKVSGGEETFICSDLQLQESGGEESQTHAVSLTPQSFWWHIRVRQVYCHGLYLLKGIIKYKNIYSTDTKSIWYRH